MIVAVAMEDAKDKAVYRSEHPSRDILLHNHDPASPPLRFWQCWGSAGSL